MQVSNPIPMPCLPREKQKPTPTFNARPATNSNQLQFSLSLPHPVYKNLNLTPVPRKYPSEYKPSSPTSDLTPKCLKNTPTSSTRPSQSHCSIPLSYTGSNVSSSPQKPPPIGPPLCSHQRQTFSHDPMQAPAGRKHHVPAPTQDPARRKHHVPDPTQTPCRTRTSGPASGTGCTE